MTNNSTAIILNGASYTQKEIPLLIAEKLSIAGLPEWESELYAFLKEWFSSSQFIKAQTSGSTGEPSIVELPKDIMISSALRTIEYFNLKEGDRALLCLPCRFIAGKMVIVRAIVGKMDLVTTDPSLESVLLLDQPFDLGAMVSNQVVKLLESDSGTCKIENIRNLLIGGSSIQATLEAQISQLKNRVVSTYGMTETASHIAIRTLSGPRRSEVYECLPGITISLGENDCLQVHVPGQRSFQTKDMAEVISPTAFRILGREDDVIISGGIKYWPEAIEKKLVGQIAGRYVISSMPDDKLGEKLVLVLECIPADSEAIQQKANEVLLPFERPREIHHLESFPETENGKIRRKEIKKRIREHLKF